MATVPWRSIGTGSEPKGKGRQPIGAPPSPQRKAILSPLGDQTPHPSWVGVCWRSAVPRRRSTIHRSEGRGSTVTAAQRPSGDTAGNR